MEETKEKSVTFSELDSSSDDDEEKCINSPRTPTSPKVIHSGRNYERECCVTFVIIFLLLLFMVVFKMLFSDSQTEDVSGQNKLLAKVYGHTNHIYRCDDRGFDCCYIYTKEKHIQINPRYIVEKDSVGSNCPSLTKLVNLYNDYLNEYDNNVNCSKVTCCEIDNSEEIKERYGSDDHEMLEVDVESKHGGSTCPKATELISKYVHNYPSPYEDLYLLTILGAIVCCLGIKA